MKSLNKTKKLLSNLKSTHRNLRNDYASTQLRCSDIQTMTLLLSKDVLVIISTLEAKGCMLST